jgi:fatty-acyl-CoA synthase
MSTSRATSAWAETWARFRPEAEAVVDLGTGRRWTWRALHEEARAWAAWLHERGVGRGDVVALLAQNRGETLALLFACADLGAILFPMNWRLSPAELAWQLDHSGARVLLADAENTGRLPGAEGLATPAPARAPAPVEVALSDPWVLMYTSGSSGRPKGALLTHRQLHWNALNTLLACDLRADDCTLTFAPLFHTGGLNSLTTPLLHRGGRVLLTPRLDVGEALRTIAAERVTLLMGVPTIFQMIADHPDFERTDLSSVRDALCGGAPLPMPLLERYAARGVPLRQGFGLTEVGPNCFSLPHADVRRKSGTVGQPIHHVAAKVVRDDGSECDPGEPGELLLKGPAVFGGYWRDPVATAAAVVDGWFRTGDVLSRDEQGYFTVRGRKKEMYISGGENVYPAEIEALLVECPGVALAAVVGVPDPRWGEVGHAFVEARPGQSLSAEAVRAFLEGRLARFKLPKHIAVLDELPRTGSGKIDKQRLQRGEVA